MGLGDSAVGCKPIATEIASAPVHNQTGALRHAEFPSKPYSETTAVASISTTALVSTKRTTCTRAIAG